MSSKNALLISPVTVIDDGKTFVCSIAAVSGRIQESATQVKTFAKPEISIVLHTVSKGKAHFTCMIKKAYPKPKLMWYMGGKILNEKSEGFQNASLAYSEFTSHITAISDSPTERLQTTLSEASKATLVSDSSSEKHLHSIKTLQKSTQTLQNDPITAFFSESTVPQSESTIPQRLKNSRITTHQNAATVTHFHENSMPPQRNLPIGRVIEVTTVNSPANSYTIKNGLDTGSTIVPKHSQIAVRHGCHESSDATAEQPPGGAVDQSRRPGSELRTGLRGRFVRRESGGRGGGGVPRPGSSSRRPWSEVGVLISLLCLRQRDVGGGGILKTRQAQRPRQGEAVALPVWQVSRRMTEEEPLPALTPMRFSN
ncbi:T-cell surface protein tactile [Crotalus adamanteus]|uniref:T-cell surface protein tactile n=1 Tax=Crotalus adamanteus TaxID=8729 RepID=A0AAW1BJK6_CROAD